MRKLPVVKNTPIKSECWTHYRMEIMQNSPNFDKWLCCHLNLTTYKNGVLVFFGRGGQRHGKGYYNQILEETEINIKDMPPESAVERIKYEIDNGYYMTVFCNYSLVLGRKFNEAIHEVFIYGYDDINKIFFVSDLQGTKFIETEVPFENLVAGYKHRYEYLIEHKDEILLMNDFFYDITKIRLKDFNNEAFYLTEFFNKLMFEIDGKFHLASTQQSILFEHETVDKFYEGIYCGVFIINSMHDFLDNKITIHMRNERFSLSLMKIYENKNILLRNFKWLRSYYSINDPLLLQSITNCYCRAFSARSRSQHLIC